MALRQRQAFGQLTNQMNTKVGSQTTVGALGSAHHNNQLTSNTNQLLKVPLRSTSSSNDENEYHHQVMQQQSAKSLKAQQTSHFDFEIYKDDDMMYVDNNITKPQVQQQQQQQQQQHETIQMKKQPLQAHCNNLMDMSSITFHSPMMLDDTIKFASRCEDSSLVSATSSDESLAGEVDDEMEAKAREAEYRENVLMSCAEYASEIIVHLKELEQVNRPKASYLKQQQDISSTMRSILVDWLVEVSEEYKLHSETLYLAVNYTDRFLSKMSVLRGKLQLLGTAAMYIAAKYEEVFPPDVAEFVYITDDTYTKQQVLRMEHLILKVLNFHMNAPTANCFLLHFLKYSNADAKLEHLSRYLAELTLVEAEPFLEYLPSEIATSAMYLAMYTLGKSWTSDLSELTGYKPEQLSRCIADLHRCMLNAPEHPQQAIQEKYKQERYSYVATIEPPQHLNI